MKSVFSFCSELLIMYGQFIIFQSIVHYIQDFVGHNNLVLPLAYYITYLSTNSLLNYKKLLKCFHKVALIYLLYMQSVCT